MSLADVSITLVDSVADAEAAMRWLSTVKDKIIAIDTESTGLSPETDKVRLVQMSDENTSWAIPMHRWGGVFEEVVKRWDGWYVGHNMQFDVAMLRTEGIHIPTGKCHDTRLMGHVLDPTESTALKYQSAKYVDANAARLQKGLDEFMTENGWNWATVPIVSEGEAAIYWQYGGLDTILTKRLMNRHYPLVQARSPKSYDLELGVVWVLEKMMRKGAKVDRPFTQERIALMDKYLNDCRAWSKEKFGDGFSLGSTRDVTEVLIRDGWGPWLTETTPSGAVKLDKKILPTIKHPLAETLMRYKQAQKVTSTFLKKFMEHSEHDGHLHPRINSIGGSGKTAGESGGGQGVRTGRNSMDTPNLQQLSKKSGNNPFAGQVRNCIIPSDGNTFVMADFDQIELRLLAHMSRDKGLIDAFNGGGDFFVSLTQTMYQDNTITKSDPRRGTTKTLTYGKIYGSGVETFANAAGIKVNEARKVYELFNSMFPGAKTHAKELEEMVKKTQEEEGIGYVLSGLTDRRFPVDLDRPYSIGNHKIQGTAAELLKLKLIQADAAGLGDHMILPVHDEIISDVPNDQVDDFIVTLRDVMNDYTTFEVPLTAGIATGTRWGTKVDLD